MEGSETEGEAERCDLSAGDPWLDFKAPLNSFNLQKFLFLPAFFYFLNFFFAPVRLICKRS